MLVHVQQELHDTTKEKAKPKTAGTIQFVVSLFHLSLLVFLVEAVYARAAWVSQHDLPGGHKHSCCGDLMCEAALQSGPSVYVFLCVCVSVR